MANRIDSPRASCALRVSSNGGASWDEVPLPVPDGHTVGCFSPDVAFGADGTLYVAFTSFGPVEATGTVPDAVWLVRSSDGGRTLSPPSRVAGPLAFQVRLGADPTQEGRLYLTWLRGSRTSTWGFVEDGNPVVVSRSEDGGSTWEAPVTVSTPARRRVVAPNLVVSRAGTTYVSYLDVGDDRLDYHGGHEGKGGEPYPDPWSLVVARSTDEGRTWSEAVVDPELVPVRRFLVLFPATPAIAVGGDERVHVAFHDGRLGDSDVWLWSSKDRGRRWDRPRRVNDTAPKDRRAQYLPQLAIGPGGRLDVVYYDRRSDADDVMNSVSIQSSFDNGRTFLPSVALSGRPFDSRVGYGSDRGMPDLGDRLGLVSTDAGALAVWTDTRAGIPETGKQDLAGAVVAVTDSDPLRRPLGAAAVVLALAGAALLFWTITTTMRTRKGSQRSGPGHGDEMPVDHEGTVSDD